MAIHQYIYQACDIEGNTVEGELSAESEQEVVSTLQNKHLIPLKVEQQTKNIPLFRQQSIKNRDLIDFTEGLTTLVEARVPLDRALELLAHITHKKVVQDLIEDLRRDVKEGKSLADALQIRSSIFSRMYVNMVHAGEEGGILEKLLPKLSEFLSAAEEAKRTILSALIYPIILGIVGFLSVILLLVFVVPSFATLFEDMGSSIPPSASFLLNLSDWLISYGWTLVGVPVLVWFGWRQLDKTPARQLQRDKILLTLPLFGNLILQSESSRFSRTLGALLGAGIPLLKSLHIAKEVMENKALSTSLDHIEESVRSGVSLGTALVNDGKFPILLAQLVIVGEETGRTGAILDKLASTFDAYVKQQTSRLVTLMEPLLILILGVIVGGIVITMLSAIFSINELNY